MSLDVLLDSAAWRDLFAAYPALWLGLAAFLGAVAASFGGVVVHRLPRRMGWVRPADTNDEAVCSACGAPGWVAAHAADKASHPSLWAPSRCDECGSRLSALALIPVLGWLFFRGRCRFCGSKVSWSYPVIEALTAAASVAFASHFGPTPEGLAALGILWTCVTLSWVDWRESLLPDSITVPLLLIGLLASPFELDPLLRIEGLALNVFGFWLSFFLVGRLKGVDTMALGDLMLAGAAGAWLGLFSVPYFLGLTAAVYVAYTLPYRLKGRIWVPMGPAISAAFLVCLWAGPALRWI